MKKIKLFVPILLTCVALSSIPVAANPLSTSSITEETSISPKTEVVKWYYRYNDEGVYQKRLWSVTNGVWITDWIDCE